MANSDLIYMEAKVRASGALNGGRISNIALNDAAMENVFDYVTVDERAAGRIVYSKLFPKNAHDGDIVLNGGKLFYDKPTPGDTWCTFFLGTQQDTQGDIPGADSGADTKTKYGVAWLKTDITAGVGVRTIVVEVENAKLLSTGLDEIFRVGGSVRLARDGVSPIVEFLEIASLTESALEITIVVTTDIQNDYLVADESRLSSVLEVGTVAASFDVVGYTGGANYNVGSYPPVLDFIGTVEEQFVYSFTDVTNFSCTGDTLGAQLSGDKNTDHVVTNGDLLKPIVKLEAGGWSGLTIAATDTFTLAVHPAAVPIWEKQETPVGAAAEEYDYIELMFRGEAPA